IKVTNPVLNVREGSSSSYKVIDQVYEREIYKIIDTASNGWYKIKTESGNIGWVSNNLVKETAYNLKDKQKLNFAYLKITGGVNIREGDNSKYKKIGRAKRNETYMLQDVSDNGWYKIRTKEGAAGWVSNKYANPIKSIKVNNPVLNVRSGSSTKYKIIDQVYNGEIYEALRQASSGWYEIQTKKGNKGWVSVNHVEELDKHYIDDFKTLPLSYIKVYHPTVNVRSGSSTNYKIIDKVHEGDIYIL